MHFREILRLALFVVRAQECRRAYHYGRAPLARRVEVGLDFERALNRHRLHSVDGSHPHLYRLPETVEERQIRVQARVCVYYSDIPHLRAVGHYVAVRQNRRLGHSLGSARKYYGSLAVTPIARNFVHARQYPKRQQPHRQQLHRDALLADFLQNLSDIVKIVRPRIVGRMRVHLFADFVGAYHHAYVRALEARLFRLRAHGEIQVYADFARHLNREVYGDSGQARRQGDSDPVVLREVFLYVLFEGERHCEHRPPVDPPAERIVVDAFAARAGTERAHRGVSEIELQYAEPVKIFKAAVDNPGIYNLHLPVVVKIAPVLRNKRLFTMFKNSPRASRSDLPFLRTGGVRRKKCLCGAEVWQNIRKVRANARTRFLTD